MSTATATPAGPGPWLWADVGFDTTRKLWFLSLYNHKGAVQTYVAKGIVLKNGYGVQYQWPDTGRDIWHVRERIFARDVRNINYDEHGNLVVNSIRVESPDEGPPPNYAYVTYAYSLKTSRGFVEFYDSKDNLLQRINERWIIVEDLTRKTIGEYPHIRIRVEREAIKKIIISKSTIIIAG